MSNEPTDKGQAKSAEEERERLEQELASMDNKIKLLEDKLEQTEEKLSSTTSSLALIETVCFVSFIIYNRCKMQTIFFRIIPYRNSQF